MSTRTSRVEQLLRREIAAALLRGELRDPALANAAAITITGASVSADLSTARVFVDVLDEGAPVDGVLRALNGASGRLRSQIGRVVRLRRVPSLRFEVDPSIAHGAKIEQVLAELSAQRAESDGAETPGDVGEDADLGDEPR